jgi:hypothetical protein
VSQGSVQTTWVSLVSNSFVGSITVEGKREGSSDTPVAIPYRKLHLNGAVGDGSYVSTAITGTSIIEIPSTGMDVSLNTTSYTSGSMTVEYERVDG